MNELEWNLDLLIQIQFKLHCNVVHDSISYGNELVSLISKTFRIFSILQGYLFFSCFSIVFSFGANKEDLLHVTHCIYHYYSSIEIHLYQNYFSMSCHWHWNMCCLIRLHVDMLTLFKKLLTNEKMSMEKVRMEKW